MNKRAPHGMFSEAQVGRIKRQLLNGLSPKEIAEAHGCGVETIRRIGRGDSWAWVPVEGSAHPIAAEDTPAFTAEVQASLARFANANPDILPASVASGEPAPSADPSIVDRLLSEAQKLKDQENELTAFAKGKNPYY